MLFTYWYNSVVRAVVQTVDRESRSALLHHNVLVVSDEKDDSVYLIRVESNNKSKQLKKTIQSLRQQFSGALPLAQQEKFSNVMARLDNDVIVVSS